MKYLIAGLGNIGDEYKNTRHNIGFKILDAFAEASNISFKDGRRAYVAEAKYKSRSLILIKPTTYMNLSGTAIQYWMIQEKIPVENILVIVDDIALPFGVLRLKPKGSDAGHNGLKNINQLIGHQNYARLRFGIGDNYPKGRQVDYVLGNWSEEETSQLKPKLETGIEIIQSFVTIGIAHTMNIFNNK